jgi:hypothetical protein
MASAGAGDEPESAVLGCDVAGDRQGWWVVLVVVVGDEVVENRIGPYLGERQARVAAGHIERAAGRQAPPPSGF